MTQRISDEEVTALADSVSDPIIVGRLARDLFDLRAERDALRAWVSEYQWSASSYPEDNLCPECGGDGGDEYHPETKTWTRHGEHDLDCSVPRLLSTTEEQSSAVDP